MQTHCTDRNVHAHQVHSVLSCRHLAQTDISMHTKYTESSHVDTLYRQKCPCTPSTQCPLMQTPCTDRYFHAHQVHSVLSCRHLAQTDISMHTKYTVSSHADTLHRQIFPCTPSTQCPLMQTPCTDRYFHAHQVHSVLSRRYTVQTEMSMHTKYTVSSHTDTIYRQKCPCIQSTQCPLTQIHCTDRNVHAYKVHSVLSHRYTVQTEMSMHTKYTVSSHTDTLYRQKCPCIQSTQCPLTQIHCTDRNVHAHQVQVQSPVKQRQCAHKNVHEHNVQMSMHTMCCVLSHKDTMHRQKCLCTQCVESSHTKTQCTDRNVMHTMCRVQSHKDTKYRQKCHAHNV